MWLDYKRYLVYTGSRFNKISLLLVLFVGSVAFAQSNVTNGNADHISSENISQESSQRKLQHKLAQELVSVGRSLEGNPSFEDVLFVLKSKAKSYVLVQSNNSSNWFYRKTMEHIPNVKNKMANAALEASSTELLKRGSNIATHFANAMTSSMDGRAHYDLSSDLRNMSIVSSLEGIKAAAGASTYDILNRLEIDYRLSDANLEEYSILTMQPLFDSKNLRHNVFAQLSYSKKEPADIFLDPRDYRHTGNAGFAYRYITPDMKHMFGSNVFLDHQWPYHHNRMSVGLDYKNSLVGVSANKYIGLSDWRGRNDGYEEIVLDGEDVELSGRLPQFPQLELFAKGYHWNQNITSVLNPDDSDIYGYKLTAEYTPLNGFTISSSVRDDNVRSSAVVLTMYLARTLNT